MNLPSAYELLEQVRIDEIGADAYRIRHKKTNAHLILLDTPDDNKVFSVTFRTRPSDDTGVPHIMEHSVLCGSDRYPVKDPFVELAKGSLNTFLNAMTWPDKTMYPVASMNDQDFKNLMSVYMDAVFHPNIYKTDKIFRQEGWHYELESPEAELKYNGVVYNEMRGVFSDPDSLLERFNKAVLFPDTSYAYESGGDPTAIPTLTYEDFIAFHKRFYSPSNAYIYLYGAMDFYERLEWLDSEYLGKYEAIDPDSEILTQAPFAEMKRESICYGISEGEDENEHIFSWSKVVDGLLDPVDNLALEVLGYALLNAPGAPVKQALLDAGIGNDIYGGYDSGYKQCIFNVIARGAEKEDLDRFTEIIVEELKKSAANGIPKKTLYAGINNIEFSLREADYGRYPKGLIYAMTINDTWLFDEEKAFIHLQYDASFEKLKALAETDYFEKLITDRLIKNEHGAVILVSPVKGYTQELEEKTREALAAYKASLSEEEIDAIVNGTKELKEYQETPSTQEELMTIPLLSISDIERKPAPFVNEERELCGIPVDFHCINTSGIAYFEIHFDLSHVEQEDFRYIALLKALYTMLSTEQYSYQELNDEISLYLGGLGYDMGTYTKLDDHKKVYEEFVINSKAVYANAEDMFRLITEVTNHTVFDDARRIREIVAEMRTQMQNSMISSGHSTALKRVLSYSCPSAYEDDQIIGLSFYKFIEDLDKHFDERKDALILKLKELSGELFTKKKTLISLTCDEAGFEAVREAFPVFADTLPERTFTPAARQYDFEAKNEGFKTSSQVQYVSMGGNFKDHGYPYTGVMRVLRTVMGYEYLWINLRVKGGAYGCMSMFGRNGEMAFVSYRDPNLRETAEVYRGIPDYLKSLEIADRDMTKYIIGTISEMDVPLQPAARGARSFAFKRGGMSYEALTKEREQVLNCTVEDLRALEPVIRDVLSDNLICAVGSEAKIEADQTLFSTIRLLAGETE